MKIIMFFVIAHLQNIRWWMYFTDIKWSEITFIIVMSSVHELIDILVNVGSGNG